MDADEAVKIVQAAIGEVAGGQSQVDPVELLERAQAPLVARVQTYAPDAARTAEGLLTTLGMALLTWGFWILQCKSIEHYGEPAEGWRTFFRQDVIAALDKLLLDARNAAREHKAAEQAGDKPWIVLPPPFTNWHEDPAGRPGQIPDDPPAIIRSLDAQGIWGLDHLRLWGYFNDLLRDGIDRTLRAPTSLYLTATAHGYLALVYLRKLLDRDPRSVGLDYLLRVVEARLGDLGPVMAQRPADLRIDMSELRQRIADHRSALAELRERTAPALALANKMILHLDRDQLRDPVRVGLSRETLAGHFRAAQWIVNGWDYAWSWRRTEWEEPANRDDFADIGAALRRGA